VNLIDTARADFAMIMNSESGSGRLVEFSSRDKAHSCVIRCSTTIVNTTVDIETALNVNGERSHLLISLELLEASGYPIRRDVSDPTKITLTGDIVRWSDYGKEYAFTCEDVRPTSSNGSTTIYLGRWLDE